MKIVQFLIIMLSKQANNVFLKMDIQIIRPINYRIYWHVLDENQKLIQNIFSNGEVFIYSLFRSAVRTCVVSEACILSDDSTQK